MSPTVFRWRRYRFYFFSREEERMHVHVSCAEGEAKFWIDPEIALARNHGIREAELTSIRRIIEEHRDEITAAWNAHFRH